MATALVIGSYLSPYVRKVLACLHLKQIPYEIDPIVPFYGNDAFSRVSPLRRVPVLIDDAVTLSDSTAICEYLEERYPDPPLMPAAVADRARARWLEEFADSRMGEVFIWHLFNQVAIRRAVWNEGPDAAVLAHAQQVEVPSVLDYLETELPADGFLFGRVCTADIAVASFFRNAAFARYTVDAARWPRTAAHVARVLDLPALSSLRPFEDVSRRTPIEQHRDALKAAGAPVSERSFRQGEPRRGIMSI